MVRFKYEFSDCLLDVLWQDIDNAKYLLFNVTENFPRALKTRSLNVNALKPLINL